MLMVAIEDYKFRDLLRCWHESCCKSYVQPRKRLQTGIFRTYKCSIQMRTASDSRQGVHTPWNN